MMHGIKPKQQLKKQPPNMDFKSMRFYSGFTLRKVEELTGISNAYLSQLENGKIKRPSYEFVTRLMSLYNTMPKEEKAIQILNELCQLKKYKDTVGKDSFYEKRQPELWKEANDFLSSINTSTS